MCLQLICEVIKNSFYLFVFFLYFSVCPQSLFNWSHWWRICVVVLLFGFFYGCRGFCHRTQSDLFLFFSWMNDGINEQINEDKTAQGLQCHPLIKPARQIINHCKFDNRFLYYILTLYKNAYGPMQLKVSQIPYGNAPKFTVYYITLFTASPSVSIILHPSRASFLSQQCWIIGQIVNYPNLKLNDTLWIVIKYYEFFNSLFHKTVLFF